MSDSSVRCPACLADLPETARTVLHPSGDFEVLEGKWAIEKKLGQGGMGSVYLAHDVGLDRRVAIKMMAMSLADNPELVTRFEREARIMAKLEHPNVVPVYAVGRRDGVPYIVMKFLEGLSLQDYLKARGRLPLGEVLSITQQACEGLQFIHDRGVVHRDIKPANIFVAPNGHVTLLDLGVAHDAQHSMTRSGVIVGTPRYMAPEQVLGRRVDFHADLYALATVLFEMLTGAPVFDHDSDYSIMRAHIDEQPPPPSSRADVPETLTPVLARALAKEPADRYPSALALADALADALPGVKPVRAQPLPNAPAALKAPTPPPELATPRSDPQLRVGTAPRAPAAAPTRAAPPEPAPVPPTCIDAPSAVSDGPAAAPGPVPAPPSTGASSKLSTNELQSVRRRGGTTWVAVGAAAAVLLAVALWQPWRGEPSRAEAPPTRAEVTLPAPPAEPAPRLEDVPAPKEPQAVAEPAPVPGPAPGRAAAVVPRKPAERTPAREGELRLVVTAQGKLSWGYVDLDGLRQGTTPLTVRTAPGKHTLVFHREGFDPETRTIDLQAGETKKLVVDLAPSPRAW